MKTLGRNGLILCCLGVLILVGFVMIDPVQPQENNPDARKVTVPLNGVKVLSTESDIDRVVTGENNFVNVKVSTTKEILVFGLAPGATTLHVWTDQGLKQYMLVVSESTSQSFDEDFRKILTSSGDTGTDNVEMRVFTPEYRGVTEFQDYIDQLLKDDGRVLLSDEQSGKIFVVGKPNILSKINQLMDRLDVPGKDKVYSKRLILKNRPVTQLEESLSEMLSDEGKLIIDRETNSVLVVDKVAKVNQIESYTEEIDVPTVTQVRITSRFVEVEENFRRNFGIDWSIDANNSNYAFSTPSGGSASVPSSFSGLELGLVNAADVEARIQALESKDHLNLISSPNVVTRNQQQAELTIQDEQSYVSGCNVSQTEGGTIVTPEIDQIQDGITLNVTPLIGKNKVIQLDVIPELKIATLGGETDFGGTNCSFFTPSVDVRRAKLNVAIRDGQTLVIGGLSRKQDEENTDEVPGVNDIPVLGDFLFSDGTQVDNSKNITIFITAEIIEMHKPSSDTTPRQNNLPDTRPESSATKKHLIERDIF